MMTVKECYESMESDYEGVMGRMGSEEMVKRFALKFLDDPSYLNLEKAIQEQNAEEAFRAAHTLKGLCLNLGFDRLYKVSEELTEKLRGRELDGYEALYGNVQKEYKNTIDAIQKMKEQLVSVADVYDAGDFDKYDGYNAVEEKNYFETENNVFPRNDISTKIYFGRRSKRLLKNGRIRREKFICLG